MTDEQYAAALSAAGRVAAAYAGARPAVTTDEHIKAIVRVFETIFDAAATRRPDASPAPRSDENATPRYERRT